MTKLLDYSKQELLEIVSAYNMPKFRAEQLFIALHNGKDYEDKMNLPKEFISKLKENGIIFQCVKIIKEKKGSDGTTKFLYELPDGNIVEGVLMQYKFGNTICVSTQVGCKMNCQFCASGLNGFVRNLSAGEIIGQVVAVNKYLKGSVSDRKITNIVLMGSGEPLDNYINVLKFLSIITSEDSFNFSVRNISVSTCGIPTKIEELADSGYSVTLSISLHAPTNEIRKKIMPIAKSYSIESVLDSAKYYNSITNRRIIIEYTLIDEVNNKPNHARILAELLNDLPCHVNLIKLNEVDGRYLKSPSVDSCKKFLDVLTKNHISATLRRTLGDDVEGACGQLRNSELKQTGDNNKIVTNKDYKVIDKKQKEDIKDRKYSTKSFEKIDKQKKVFNNRTSEYGDKKSNNKKGNVLNKKDFRNKTSDADKRNKFDSKTSSSSTTKKRFGEYGKSDDRFNNEKGAKSRVKRFADSDKKSLDKPRPTSYKRDGDKKSSVKSNNTGKRNNIGKISSSKSTKW